MVAKPVYDVTGWCPVMDAGYGVHACEPCRLVGFAMKGCLYCDGVVDLLGGFRMAE